MTRQELESKLHEIVALQDSITHLNETLQHGAVMKRQQAQRDKLMREILDEFDNLQQYER